MEQFNGLTPAEHERLAILIEEMSEVIQISCKILRHGYESTHPNSVVTNRMFLEKELGDVRLATLMLYESGDISKKIVHEHAIDKSKYISKYLHHQIVGKASNKKITIN